MLIFKIISGIICIALLTGIAAALTDKRESTRHRPYGFYERYAKRGFDAFLAAGALMVLSPLLLIVALLVRIRLGSPVLFAQERPGRDGKIFVLYKFRTMLPADNGSVDLSRDAERLTPFGRKLRSTSLDELPELLNIIKGDMSVVGPRPLLVRYLPRYNAHQARRHEVRPGITGLAQVNGRNAISWEEKLDLDVQYVDRITFLGDLKIILNTVRTVVKHEGISGGGTETMTEFMGSDNE